MGQQTLVGKISQISESFIQGLLMGMGKRENYSGPNTIGNKGMYLPKTHQIYYQSRLSFGIGEKQELNYLQEFDFIHR